MDKGIGLARAHADKCTPRGNGRKTYYSAQQKSSRLHIQLNCLHQLCLGEEFPIRVRHKNRSGA